MDLKKELKKKEEEIISLKVWISLCLSLFSEMKREKKGVLWRGVVLETLNNDFRVSKHRKGANISRAEVGGKVEGIDTSNKFRLIGGSKRCSGGKASDFFSKMVNNGARAPLERDSTRSSIKENTKREVRGLSPWIRG